MVVNKIATNKLTLTQTKTSASSQNMVKRIQFTPTDKKPAVCKVQVEEFQKMKTLVSGFFTKQQ